MGLFSRVCATPTAPDGDASTDPARRRRRRWLALLLALAVVATTSTAAGAEEDEDDTPDLPELPPSAVMVDQLSVDSRSDAGTDSTVPLTAGQTYIVEATGTALFTGDAVADPECANLGSSDPTFQREWFSVPDTADLLVDRQGIEWVPTVPDAQNCNTEDHTYRTFLVPETTKRFNFVFSDGGWRGDNSGSFTVRILVTDQVAPAGAEIDEFGFSADDADGADSGVLLDPGRSYRIRVSGSFTFNESGNVHDAECLSASGLPGQRADALDDQGSTPDVIVDDEEINWVPVRGRTGCDDRDHTYIYEVSGVSGAINLRVRDDIASDNAGFLLVEIFDLGETSDGDDPAVTLPDGGIPEPGGGAPAPPSDVLMEELVVDSRSASGTTTMEPLIAGQTYLIEAGGVARFGNGIADPECAAFDLLPTWKREYFTDAPHTVDILVDGKGVEWVATVPDGEGCNTTDHTYRYFAVPQTTRQFNFAFADGGWRGDNTGQLTVRIYVTDRLPPAGTKIDEFTLETTDADGVDSNVTFNSTRSYRVRVEGAFRFNDTSSIGDAECVQTPTGAPGQRQDALDDAGSTPDVLLQEQEVDWVPVQGRTGCDDRNHAYIFEVSDFAGRLNVVVRDTWHGDNAGSVNVKVFDLGPTTGEEPAGPPVDSPVDLPEAPSVPPQSVVLEQFTVDSRSSSGTTTTAPLVAGQTYLIEAGGTVAFGAGQADAECASLPPTLPTWKREYFTDAPNTTDLLIDGIGREWTAVTPDAEGCNTETHFYRLFYVPETTKVVNFLFNDGGWRGDNAGSLTVRVLLTDAVPPAGTLTDQFSLDTADAQGATSTVTLASGNAYRVQVAGSFTYTNNASTHDAECLRVGGSAPGTREDALDELGSTPDVLFRGNQVSWSAAAGRTGCDDRTNTYFIDVSGVSGKVNLVVRDTWHGDNSGILNVKIFDLGPAS